jgi:hypothetical protein
MKCSIDKRLFHRQLYKHKCCNAFVLIIIFVISTVSVAQVEVELVQPLDFGQVVVLRNDSVGTYVIDKRGRINYSTNFGIITPGQNGLYRVSGLTPNTVRTFNIVSIATEMNTNGGAFNETFDIAITDFDNERVVDSNGEVLIRFGGTISTSGSTGVNFEATPYNATIQFTINL